VDGRERDQGQRRGEHQAPRHVGLPDSDARGDPLGQHRPEHPADGASPQDQAEHTGPDMQHSHRVQREQSQEHQVEQVDDRHRHERRAHDRRTRDEPQAGGDAARRAVGRRLGRADPAEEERGAQEGQGVGRDRERRGQGLGEQPARGRSGHVGQRPAAVEQRLPVHVVIRCDDRHEQGAVRYVEQDGQGARGERHGEHLPQRQHVQRVAHRDRGHQRRPAEVGGDHRLPPLAAPVRPGARVHSEQQARQPLQCRQQPHRESVGVQREHRRERHRDGRDLVAEQRDSGRAPVPPEHHVTQQRWHALAQRRRPPFCDGLSGGLGIRLAVVAHGILGSSGKAQFR
jgi:hypothetical protein